MAQNLNENSSKPVKLKDFLIEMGVIEEAVLMSHDTDKAVQILNNVFQFSEYGMLCKKSKGKDNSENLHRIIGEFSKETSHWDERSLKLLNMYLYNLGYFQSYYNSRNDFTWKKYDVSSVLQLLKTNNLNNIIFDISHDVSMDSDKLPTVAYHVTPYKYVDKIKRMGLCPKSIEKFEKHPDRIYFALKSDDINKLLHDHRFTRNETSFSVFQINPKEIHRKNTNVQFAEDRSFIEHAIYTLYNIHTDDLKIVKEKLDIK